MKTLKKILLPALALASAGIPVSIVSCSDNNVDSLPTVDTNWLKIEEDKLLGFNDDHLIKENFDKTEYQLVVPASVKTITPAAFDASLATKDAGLVIRKVSFEQNSQCTEIGSSAFAKCINLEKVVFPKSYTTFKDEAFTGCKKLTTIDISLIEKDCTFPYIALATREIPNNGQFIIKKDNLKQKNIASELMKQFDAMQITGWQLKNKNN